MKDFNCSFLKKPELFQPEQGVSGWEESTLKRREAVRGKP